MKKWIVVLGLLLLALSAVLYLRHTGVTHEDLYRALVGESSKIQGVVDDRYQRLDQKLDRIERKLDRILEMANRPLPDNLQRVN